MGARDLSPLPGDPAALCAYLTERAAAGIAISSLDGACTAIRHVHRMHAAADPVASEIVRQVCLGLRRTYGTAPRRLARPLSTAGIRQILDGIDRTDPVGVRDAAIILLGSRDRTGDPRWFLASTPERQVVHSGHAWFNHRLTSGKQHPAITAGPQGRIARFPWLLPWHGVPQAFRTADPLNQQAAA